jgi:hypothetical protein
MDVVMLVKTQHIKELFNIFRKTKDGSVSNDEKTKAI